MERKAFPRGGATEDHIESRNEKNSYWLSDQKKKKPSKKSRNNSESDPEADYELEKRLQKEDETKVTIYDLSYRSIQRKMKLLARVAEVHDNFVQVYLPGGLLGTIPIFNVIEMMGDSLSDKANVPLLTDLFKIDQLVIVEVINVVRDAKSKQGKGTAVYLTVNPTNIYQGWSHRDVARVGFILQAYVRGVEDHGYILDCGIKDLHVFLNKKECVKYCKRWNNGKSLVKGQIVCGVVIKANSANVQSQVEVSVEPGKVARAQKKTPGDIEDTAQLLPGMRFNLEVTKKLSNGLSVNFDEFEGFLVDRNIPHKMKDADVGNSFLGCLLFISKPLNVPMFSIVPSVVDSAVVPVREFTFGDIIKSAVVESESFGGIGLLLNKKTGTRGKVPPSIKKAAEKESKSQDLYKIGSTVRCRVLNFDSLSECYLCTTQESALKERIFCVADVPVGSVVTATVTGITEKYLTVSVGAVAGYIQWYHTADAPFKNFAEKFNVGQKIKGRVLKHNGEKLDITAKETLVKKECPVLKSYDDAIEGKEYPGTVVSVRGVAAVVNFFGGVRGILPYSKTDIHFKKGGSFNIGRLVKCSVVSCQNEELVLSLSDTADKVTVGFKCSPIVAGIDRKNRVLQVVNGSSVRGIVPVYHLHDNQKLAGKIFHTYSIGDTVEDARCFLSQPGAVFSTRGSVRRFFDSDVGERLFKEELLQPGNIMPCFVKSVGYSDVTFSTPLKDYNFVHRIRKEKLVTKNLQVGDYVPLVVKDAEKRIFDEHVSDVLEDKIQTSVDFLADILHGNEKLEEHAKKSASPLSTFSFGEIVRGPVESQCEGPVCPTESGYKICLPNGVKGHVNKYCTDGDLTIGEIVEGKVIYVDYERSELILSLQKEVRSKLLVNSSSNVEDGARVSGRIVRGFSEFYLAVMNVGLDDALTRAFIPKYVYPSRGAPLAVTKGMFGEQISLTVVRKNGNDLLCVPTKRVKTLSRKVKTETGDKKAANNTSEGKEKKKRKRRKRKSSLSSVELEEAKVSKNESVEEVAHAGRNTPNENCLVETVGSGGINSSKTDPSNLSPIILNKIGGMVKKSLKRKDIQKQGILQRLAAVKQLKKKGLNANINLPKKLKNEKVLSALIDSITSNKPRSPLCRSSDSTRKCLTKIKLGKNKDTFKSARKPAKRLKK